MNRSRFFKVLLSLILVLYPILVYLGLKTIQPTILALILLMLAFLRVCFVRDNNNFAIAAFAGAVLVLILTLSTNEKFGLYLYPLLINLSLFGVFFTSLLYPPTIVERIARRLDGDIPPQAIAYTRKVTIAWCVFFLLNGTISIISLQVSEPFWALYNGLLSYLLIGLMFAGEYVFRRRVMKQHGD